MDIRPAQPTDAAAAAAVQIAGWRAAYRGLVPDAFLDDLDGRRFQAWRSGRIGDAGVCTLVAEVESRIVGVVDAGRSRDHDANAAVGEIYALYVDPGGWGRGIGTALMAAATGWLHDEGFQSAMLWVLEDNERARRFYEHLGWHDDGDRHTLDLGGPVPEARYRRML